ncbi:SURF1 family cytochrome oxidase biogenesis protein [Nakamurella endophytica]|uniref:SURF1-like protein n=1 Tax=Nakamurella endophytica TaxID=1748367 RepID=A0A917TEJ1_9ACTN|nr:SURF1 family cytochrome oxidase biogenesis protein [Nakamurella endophytica]GGM17772.1 hypothetical protein GCM10011594_42330 [Nakamurella endophytica]
MTGTAELAGPARPVRTGSRWAFLRRPGWIGAIVGALLFAAACWLVLAPWQFGRHTERSAQNSDITSAMSAPAEPVGRYLTTTAEPDPRMTWHQVTATGSFDPAGQALVRLRQDQQGTPASEVVVPFRLTDGTTVIVDRGYVGQNATDIPPPPQGEVTLTGRVQPDQPDPLHRRPITVDGSLQVTGIDGAELQPAAAAAGTLRQGFVQLVQSSPGALREIGVPQIDDGPYLSYALQWCAFGGMALLAIAYFVWREAFDPREADDRDAEPAGGADAGREGPTVAAGGTGDRAGAVPVGVPADPGDPAGRDTGGGTRAAATATSTAGRSPDGAGAGRTGGPRGRRRFDKSQLYD